MEQQKVGTFLQTLRKEKNLTQKELAEKLRVTDRAISKWENGRGMPDVSLMKPLCDILGITVSELLSGERIGKEDYQEKSEFRFLDTIEISEKKIKKKNSLLWVATTLTMLLVLTTVLLIYILPVTRGYFRPDEEIAILYIHKTIPICEDGKMPERYESGEFIDQDITEKIDMERLMELLPLMRISIGTEQANQHWVGDVTYEIFGCFRNGPRAGKSFSVYLGDWNYLMNHVSNRGHQIVNPENWLTIFEWLEGWEAEDREIISPAENRTFSVYYQGTLYAGQGQVLDLPQDAVILGTVQKISPSPDEEWESSFGIQGYGLCTWTEGTQTYLAVEFAYDKAYGISIESL